LAQAEKRAKLGAVLHHLQMGQTTSSGSVHDKYFIQKVKLGQGSFGTVWRAKDRVEGHTVAIKQLDRATMPKRGVRREDIEREVTMMKACSHENLTKLFDFYEDSQSLYLCLEYCDGGDFGDKVKEKGMALQEHEAADWVRQFCNAIQALHHKSICHRDIKPDNFMISGDTLKLSDFGLALVLSPGKLLTDKCGTPAFMAPEQHALPRNSRGYGFPVDMWAAGVSMYMLMFGGRHPFLTSDGKLNDDLLSQGSLDFRENQGNWFGFQAQLRFSEEARSLCQSMVNPKTDRRLTAAAAVKVPWLAQGKEAKSGERGANSPPAPTPGKAAPTVAPGGKDVEPAGWFGAVNLGYPNDPIAQPAAPTQALRNQGEGGTLVAENQQLKVIAQGLQDALRQKTREFEDISSEMARRISTNSVARKPILPKGTPCRYFSAQYGWLPGKMEREYANADGTVDLDIRQQAAPDKISPAEKVRLEEAWPPGTTVSYQSQSSGEWHPAEIESYNAWNFTYNLKNNVKQHAEVRRLRLRVGDRLPAANANPNEAASSSGAEPRQDGMESGYRQESSGKQTVLEGWHCQVTEHEGSGMWLPAVIERIDAAQSEVTVYLAAPERSRRLRVSTSSVRAPKEASLSWPRNTEVLYYTSKSVWMQAKIFEFRSNGMYDLDIREGADPTRIRPSW